MDDWDDRNVRAFTTEADLREHPQRGPTRYRRRVRRGDTLLFLDQVFQDVLTKQLFTVPVASPPLPIPPDAVPYDITSATLWFTAKYNFADPDQASVIEVKTGSGIVHTTPTSGNFTVTTPPIDTIAFPDSRVDLDFDIQLKDASGNIFTLEGGLLEVIPDITRAIS